MYNDQIVKFISDFVKSGKNPDVIIRTFFNGYCYYFAIILMERFSLLPDKEILYDPIEGHFVTRIGDQLYDIRGNVTNLFDIHKLYTKEVWSERKSIIYGCILKEDYDICGSN